MPLTPSLKPGGWGKTLAHLIWGLGVLAIPLSLPSPAQGQGAPEALWRANANAERVRSVAFSGDGNLLAAGGGRLNDTRVTVWRVGDGSLVEILTNAVIAVESVVFSPDARTLAATGGLSVPEFPDYTLINLWDVSNWNWRAVTNLGYPAAIQLAFSPSGKYLAAAGGGPYGDLAIFEMPNGNLLKRYGQNISGYGTLAFSPDDQELASSVFGAASTQIRDATTGTVKIELQFTGSVAFSPDGATLMIAEDRIEPPNHDWGGHTIWIAETGTGAIITNLLHPKSVYTAAFTPDGKAIVSWAGDNKIRFWSLRDYLVFQVYDQETTAVWALAVSPNGRYFAYGRDDGVVVLARMPLWITEIVRTNNEVRLSWAGGSGLYQLQRSTDLASGIWDSVGFTTTETSATVAATNAYEFFRVRSETPVTPATSPSHHGR